MNKLEQGRIPGRQLTFLIASFIMGSALIISPGAGAGRDSWIALIIGSAEGLILVFLFITLARRYPDQNLIEINSAVFGPFLGKLVSVCYLWYFFQLGSIILRSFGDFFTAVFYPETPMLVLLIMQVLICASAARNGIEVISRCSLVLLPLLAIFTLITSILLLPEMDFANFRPFFDTPLKDILFAAHGVAIYQYGETVAILMLLAFLQKKYMDKASYLSGFAISFLIVFVAAIRNIAVLGAIAEIDIYPSYAAVRMVSIADVITRIEILVAVNLLFVGFLKISVLYYITALGLAQLCKLNSYLPLLPPLGALMISLSLLQFESNAESVFFVTFIYPFYGLLFQLFLPGLTLLVSIIRGQSSKEAKT